MTESDDDDAGFLAAFDHDAWRTLAGVAGGYGLLVVGMFLALFVIPFLVFLVL